MHARPDRSTGGGPSRWHQTLHIARSLVPKDLAARFSQSRLQLAWVLIGPAVTLAVYGLVLTQGFGLETTCAPYLSTAWTGMVLWTFFATGMSAAVLSILGSADLLTKLRFPMESLPISAVGSSLVDLGVGAATLVVLLAVQGVRPGWWAVAAIAPVAVLVVWTLALGMAAAALAARWRDAVHGVGLALRIGFFMTPVVYEAAQVPPQFAWTERINPVAVAITEVRNTLLCNTSPSPRLVTAHLVVGLVVLGLTWRTIARAQPDLVDHV